jgi:lipid kinase YegS
MTKTHLRLILNGKSAARADVRSAVKAVRDRGHDVSVRVTWEAGDTQRLTREALSEAQDGSIDVLVAGGGDGTVNEVISSALDVLGPEKVAPFSFAVLPLGTANDFARGMGLDPKDLEACLVMAAEGTAKPTDLGMVNERAFANVATGGFGTSVTTQTDPQLKRLLGGAAYIFTGINRFHDLVACSGHIRSDGFEWQGQFLALAIGNGRQAGGGVELCPDAELDDGLLDLTVVPAPTVDDVPVVLRQILEGGEEGLRRSVVTKKLKKLTIESEAPLQINLDGEPLHSEKLEIVALPGRIGFKRP